MIFVDSQKVMNKSVHHENPIQTSDVSSMHFKTKIVTKKVIFSACLSKLSDEDSADQNNNTYNLCNNATGLCEFECLPGWKGNNCSIGIYILSIHICLKL